MQKARCPRAFCESTGNELGFDYYSNKNCIDRRFDSHIGKPPSRNAVLLVGNCERHGKPDTPPEQGNFEVKFLPVNITSKIQPLDAG